MSWACVGISARPFLKQVSANFLYDKTQIGCQKTPLFRLHQSNKQNRHHLLSSLRPFFHHELSSSQFTSPMVNLRSIFRAPFRRLGRFSPQPANRSHGPSEDSARSVVCSPVDRSTCKRSRRGSGTNRRRCRDSHHEGRRRGVYAGDTAAHSGNLSGSTSACSRVCDARKGACQN